MRGLRGMLCLIGGLLAGLAASPVAAAEPQITWRVENPFRFFTDPAKTEMHRATFNALTEDERRHPVLSAERALAERHNGEGWAAGVLDATCWDPLRNRYACRQVGDYMNPKSHRVILEVKGVDATAGVDCTWLTAPKSGRGRGTAVTTPCEKPIVLDIPYPSGVGVTVQVGGVEIAATDVRVTDLLIVGMGDSFGSGEGNPDVPVRFSRERVAFYGAPAANVDPIGYPARVGAWQTIGDKAFVDNNPRWLDQACHRSLYSHQLRTALQLAIEDPHRAVTYVGYACSGAEIVYGLFLRYKGHEWVPNPPDLSQISAVAQAQCSGRDAPAFDLPEGYHLGNKVPELKGGLVLRKCDSEKARKIDLLLVSIGGNDVGFSRLVANAVLADKSVLRRIGGWIGEVHGFVEASQQLDQLEDRYKSLNRALHNILHIPWSEADRVLLVSYPALTLLDDGRSVCPDGQAGMTVVADFALSEEKAKDSMIAAERLHQIMNGSAGQYGWSFVATHRDAFRGRGICAGWTANALSSADDLRLPRRIGETWQPYNPADWRAYTTRQRWFRTPNDAFMTGNFHVPRSLAQKALPTSTLSWFQVLLASLYSGAFHPTAEGQAAIADAVVAKARKVLEKYEDRPARRQQ